MIHATPLVFVTSRFRRFSGSFEFTLIDALAKQPSCTRAATQVLAEAYLQARAIGYTETPLSWPV